MNAFLKLCVLLLSVIPSFSFAQISPSRTFLLDLSDRDSKKVWEVRIQDRVIDDSINQSFFLVHTGSYIDPDFPGENQVLSQECVNSICIGNFIIDNEGQPAYVEGTFPNGEIYARYSGMANLHLMQFPTRVLEPEDIDKVVKTDCALYGSTLIARDHLQERARLYGREERSAIISKAKANWFNRNANGGSQHVVGCLEGNRVIIAATPTNYRVDRRWLEHLHISFMELPSQNYLFSNMFTESKHREGSFNYNPSYNE